MDRVTPHPIAQTHTSPDELPPFLGSWKRVYLVILLYLFTLIGVLYGFTKFFGY